MSGKINTTLSKTLGSLQEWKNITCGLQGSTSLGHFRVLTYADGIVRITISREAFEDFSYAVIAQPADVKATITESTDGLVLKTKSLTLKIAKNPVRFTLLTTDGRVINEDDAAFGTSWNGEQVTTYKKLQEGERFIGLGEKTGPLDRKGHGYTHWNTDNFAYAPGADPLYCSTPFYIGIHNKIAYGVFFDNTHKSYFNFGASNNRFASFAADSGEMDYYYFHAPSVAEIIKQYTHVTGRMEMPPLWSIGYQQCRYSYYPDKEVLNLARTFREKDIPADTIVFDIHYMEQYKIFSWSNRDFPDPKTLLQQLRDLGFQVVVMCDPGIKVEAGYKTYEDGVKQEVFLKYPDGSYYTGQVWPGWCHFPDFTNPATRKWWQDQFQEYVDLGVEGFWNDMNEIATWGHMLPENVEFDFDGNKASMRRGRNIYGYQMARSTYEGTKALLKGKRPFNLTRSAFSGIQRYSAVWTGDNVAYDEHMLLGVRLVNSMGLTGIAFAGYDVGGFVGDANSKLFARWLSIAAFSPFFRGHSMINSRDSEPWAYGEEVEQISRNYIKFRYRLLPYIYSLFYDAASTGMPVQRSLAIEYPHDQKIYDGQFHNQYLFGPSILVAPVESHKDFVKVYLPEGEWYSLYNGTKHLGNMEIIAECPTHRLPVFVKAGGIIPMQPVKSNTQEVTSVLQLHVYIGAHNSSFTYYEDDGATFQYQRGQYAKREFRYEGGSRKLTVGPVEGHHVSVTKKLKVIFHGLHINQITIDGRHHTLHHEINQFFAALEKFDPIYDPEPAPQEDVWVTEVDYTPEAIVFQW
jgi:alpha-glucosidase